MLDKKQLIMHFDRNAVNYDYYANVQKKMSNVLINRLLQEKKDYKRCYKILDIGCGTGILTKRVAEIYINSEITGIDISKNMIDIVKNNLKIYNVRFLCDDIEKAKLDEKFDIIVSSATFQWFENLEDTLINITNYLEKNGVLLFSTFGENTFQELHNSYKLAKEKLGILDNSYPGQRFYSFDDILNIILNNQNLIVNGFENNEIELFDSVKDFLTSVKKIGANNSNRIKNRNPRLIKDMIELYEANYRIKDKIEATYNCMYYFVYKIQQGIAKK
jgi:malonyl-CoA O-methyltransferase